MARAITLGNGNLLVGLDYRGQVRDLYYPYVGQTNHVSGASGSFVHRIGVFVEGTFAWFDDGGFTITIGDINSQNGRIVARHEELGILITIHDAVHNEQNVFLRRLTVENLASHKREVKLFLAQQFRIGESRRGDTAMYDPRVGAIIHYKGRDTFLINAIYDGKQFTEYNIGLFGIEGKEGTWHDAFDGILEKNAIEHGSVDSIIGFSLPLAGKTKGTVDYWIIAADSIPAAHTLDEYVLEETPQRLIASTDAYWQAWLEKDARDLTPLPPAVATLYQQSLLTIRVHTDNRGGIIASSDTDMLHHGRDTYSYVWPRDGALIAYTLDTVGYQDVAERFFEFLTRAQEPQGYLMHKYLTDGALGSSWHTWLQQGEAHLPIQEDETATALFTLWHHYEISRDIEFIESIYNSFIEPAAKFIADYIEAETGLPQASFDLWEEKYGTATYTAAAVYGGLMAAVQFANLLGKDDDARIYQAIAQRLGSSIITYLYDEGLGMFVKLVRHEESGLVYDRTLDVSSLYGVVFFGVLPIDDAKVTRSLQTVEKELSVKAASQGYVRYAGDTYYTLREAGSPNAWVITTLWVAQCYIERAKTKPDLVAALALLEWTAANAGAGGTLAEQIEPHTKAHASAAPLVWSHAEFVLAVDAYLKKLKMLNEQ